MSFDNFVQTTLSVALTDTANILTLSDAIAPYRLPPTDGGVVVLADSIGRPTYVEIISYAARSGFNLTGVVRGLEGTTARAWGIGTPLYQPLTATGYQEGLDSKKNSHELIVNKSGAYTVEAADLNKIINCTSGTFMVALTAAATLGAGFSCWVWNTSPISTDVITLGPNAPEKIDGLTALTLYRGEGVQIICDGTNWQVGNKKAMRLYSENSPQNAGKSKATGNYAVAIGVNTMSSGTASIAFGFLASASSSYSTAVGGNSGGLGAVAAIGNGAMALGGSYASGVDSFAAAIGNNTSSYGSKGANSVALGERALASGINSCAVGGRLNIASGTYSTALGGFGNTASGQFSMALGGYSVAAQYGKRAFASGQFASAGDAQSGKMVLRVTTVGAQNRALTSNGGVSATAENSVVLPIDSTFMFKGQVVARNTDSDTDSMCWEIKGAIRRGAGAGTCALIGTPAIDVIASDGSKWLIEVKIHYPLGALYLTVTGEAGKTINWVCTLDTTEVTG